jgi:predicted phosphodiesterase
MSIYVTGDTHGTYDVNKILKLKNVLTAEDYLIVLGDFGICWDGGGGDNKVRNFWNRYNFKTLFIDGNHENFDLLNRYHISEQNGGKVHELGKKITHLMRGQIFEIESKSIFTFGGAASHDCGSVMDAVLSAHLDEFHTRDFRADYDNLLKYEQRECRCPGRSWWAAEVPTPEEIAEAKANLARVGNKVDYVLTHTGSSRMYRHFGYRVNEHPWDKNLIAFFDWIEENIRFKHWYFGHLHQDFIYDAKHIGFYDAIKELS